MLDLIYGAVCIWVGMATGIVLVRRQRKIQNQKARAYCRLTCIGGGEAGQCPCNGPLDCPLSQVGARKLRELAAHD